MSLARSGRYEVHIIGYPFSTGESAPNVHFHALPPFKRISLARIGARLKTLQFFIKVKPELLIVTTHDLLGVAILIRILFGTKIIYDIQENYWRNILFTNAFPPIIRSVIALFVRLKELVTAPFVSHFLLAEKCYANELGFIKDRFLVIENKCRLPEGFRRKPDNDFIQLIFTGTIAESTGVFKAVELVKKLHAIESKIRLAIIGYCAQPNVLRAIKTEVSQNKFITLTGGDEFVSHGVIMDAIASANFGMISYPISPHIENKIPTKLYEYLACELPILLQNHTPWIDTCDPFKAAIIVDFDKADLQSILNQINSGGFYPTEPGGMTWESEEKKLFTLFDHIF